MRASLVPFSSGDQWAPFFSPLYPHSPPGLRSCSLTQGLTAAWAGAAFSPWSCWALRPPPGPGVLERWEQAPPRLGVRQGG